MAPQLFNLLPQPQGQHFLLRINGKLEEVIRKAKRSWSLQSKKAARMLPAKKRNIKGLVSVDISHQPLQKRWPLVTMLCQSSLNSTVTPMLKNQLSAQGKLQAYF